MSINEFINLMQSLRLTEQEIAYLLDMDNIRQANGMYSDLDTLASLVSRLVRPLNYDIEPLYNVVIDGPEANIITREDFGL